MILRQPTNPQEQVYLEWFTNTMVYAMYRGTLLINSVHCVFHLYMCYFSSLKFTIHVTDTLLSWRTPLPIVPPKSRWEKNSWEEKVKKIISNGLRKMRQNDKRGAAAGRGGRRTKRRLNYNDDEDTRGTLFFLFGIITDTNLGYFIMLIFFLLNYSRW